MSKKISIVLVIGFLIFGTTTINAQQRMGYVDTEYILDQMPDYRSAQKQLDEMANTWKGDLQKMQDEVDRLYKNYQAEWVLLPEETRKKREDEVSQKEKDMNEYKKAKFGPEGDLFKKREQLIKPLQDKVFDAIQQLAKENSLDFVFDKAGAVTMLYSNSKFDRSDEVLDILGITKTEEKKEEDKPKEK